MFDEQGRYKGSDYDFIENSSGLNETEYSDLEHKLYALNTYIKFNAKDVIIHLTEIPRFARLTYKTICEYCDKLDKIETKIELNTTRVNGANNNSVQDILYKQRNDLVFDIKSYLSNLGCPLTPDLIVSSVNLSGEEIRKINQYIKEIVNRFSMHNDTESAQQLKRELQGELGGNSSTNRHGNPKTKYIDNPDLYDMEKGLRFYMVYEKYIENANRHLLKELLVNELEVLDNKQFAIMFD